ncbi:MAG: transposase [Verrucomicrobia bacterium]|nr:transposase [Verrucomicrobiota bacterium]
MPTLTHIFFHLQRQLFPALEEELGPLSALDEQFCQVISLLNLGPLMRRFAWVGNGCPPHERTWLFHAYLAKTVYQFPTTAALIAALKAQPRLRRLCGWDSPGDLPSEPTFSRAFAAFAQEEWAQRIHQQMIQTHASPKLVGHVSRDATAIEAPERPAPKPVPEPAAPRKRGRPKKGEQRPPPPPKRLELQPARSLAENLADLPRRCDVGCKRNSKGHQESWIGYKLHVDTIDGDIPVSAVLTSASLHDSQVAIPLAQMTAQRVRSLYDLMDSAYDAPAIWRFSEQMGHVPIIDRNRRGGAEVPMEPAAAQRFKERSGSERVNSLLKERYGGRWVRVRGAAKVMAHLMFGLIALTAMALFGRLC